MRPVNRLTDRTIRAAGPGIYGDGGNLWLRVQPSGARGWLFRYKIDRRAHNMGLGPYPDVTLAEARELAQQYRRLVRQGIDPIDRRRQERAQAKLTTGRTFREVADEYLVTNRKNWSNPKHAAQWRSTLEAYAFPVIGETPVADIGLPAILAILRPIWETRTETASRVRGRIEAVLDYAAVHGWRHGDNPARWRGFLDQVLPERSKVAPVQHHAALNWREAPAFWGDLAHLDGMAATALRWIMLTAARSGEARGATWAEIDLDHPAGPIWTVPAPRMKTKREHRVPLAPPAIEILNHMRPLMSGPSSPVFPGQRRGRPLSDASLAKVLDRLGRSDLTVHGMRSCFRDAIGETGVFEPELAEAALAHTLGNKVTQAYARGDLLARRRRLMIAWAAYLTGEADEIRKGGDMAG